MILFSVVRTTTASRENCRELLGNEVTKHASHRNCTLQVTNRMRAASSDRQTDNSSLFCMANKKTRNGSLFFLHTAKPLANQQVDFSQDQCCQIGSFGVKNQKFGPFGKHMAPKFLFAYLATFWLFCNFFVPQFCLEKELRVAHVACSRHHKTIRSGPPDNCAMR